MSKFYKGHKKVGGKKRGSKHKKTIEQELALEFLRKRIMRKWESLIEAKIDLAVGVYVQGRITDKEKNKTGLVRIYKKSPDSASIEYLISMVVGKPKEETPAPTSVAITLIRERVQEARKRIVAKRNKNSQ